MYGLATQQGGTPMRIRASSRAKARALSLLTEVHIQHLRRDGSYKSITVFHWGRVVQVRFFRVQSQGGSLARIIKFRLNGSREVETYRMDQTLKTRVYRNKNNKITKREVFRLDESLYEVQDFYPNTKQIKQIERFNFDKTSRGATKFTPEGKRQDGKLSHKEQKIQERLEYQEELRRRRLFS